MFSHGVSQSLINRLYEAKTVNLHISQQKPTEKIIKELAKLLRKNKTLDDLDKALKEKTHKTVCVRLPR